MAIGGAPFQYPLADFSSFSIDVSRLFLAFAAVAVVLGAARYEGRESCNGVFGVQLNRTGSRGKMLGAAVFACCFVLPFVLSFVVTPMFVIRYFAPATVGAIIVIAGGVATIRRDSVRVAVMLGLIVSSAGPVGAYHQTSTTENWRAASDFITSGEATDPLVILQPAWVSKALTFYGVPTDADVVGAYQGEYSFGPERADNLARTAGAHDTVYVVRRRPSTIDSVVDKLEPTHRKVDGRDFGVVTVYEFGRQSSSTDDQQSLRHTPGITRRSAVPA